MRKVNVWWNRKKNKMRKSKKIKDEYGLIDFIFDALCWLPELILLPFRIIYWFLRGFGRFIAHLFDAL